MNILFLENPQFTHGTWYLWEGLQRVLGDCIIEYPYKTLFHGGDFNLMDVAWYRRVYEALERGDPLPYGIPPFVPNEPLTGGDERHLSKSTFPSEWSTPSSQREHDEPEIVSALDSGHFQLIILGNSHRTPTIALARLKERCKHPLPPIVYLDAGERDELNAHWWHVFRPQLAFKQILTPKVRDEYKSPGDPVQTPCYLYPLPLSDPCMFKSSFLYNLGGISGSDRPLDVLSWLGETWEARKAVAQRTAEVCKRHDFVNVGRPFVSLQNIEGLPYFAGIAQSKLVVSMRGSGRDTCRYWYAPLMGSVLLCDGTMGCIHPFPFEDGVNASFYRSLDELEDKLKFLLSHPAEIARISAAGRKHLRRFHTVEARAMFFLGIVTRELGLTYNENQRARIDAWKRQLDWSSDLPEWEGAVVDYEG